MARVSITIPDELYDEARAAGLSPSQAARTWLRGELERRHKLAEMDRYFAALEAEQGPITPAERDDADRRVRAALDAAEAQWRATHPHA